MKSFLSLKEEIANVAASGHVQGMGYEDTPPDNLAIRPRKKKRKLSPRTFYPFFPMGESIKEYIEKHGKKWIVTNKNKTKILGTHTSKEKATSQLAAIEANK